MLERLPQDGGVHEGVVVHLHHELGRAALPWNQIIRLSKTLMNRNLHYYL